MELQDLDNSLKKHPIEEQVRAKVFEQIWQTAAQSSKSRANSDLQPYFEYYWERCRKFLLDGGRYVLVKTHDDIIMISQKILDGGDRDTIRSDLLCRFSTTDLRVVDTSVDLCASLVSMIEIGEHEFRLSGSNPIHWKEGSLRQCVATRFTPQEVLDPLNMTLGRGFTVRNLSLISGIKIKWTTNLADYLLLTDDDQAIWIFHGAKFLKMNQSLSSGLFSPDLIEETLRTLALLFPQNDAKTKAWIQSEIKATKPLFDPEVAKCGSLRTHERRFEEFKFWHDRLIILKQAFDESRPRTWSQWWFDRRDGNRWYTFWIAVLVFVVAVVFGVVQSVEGALQVWLSYKALQQSGG